MRLVATLLAALAAASAFAERILLIPLDSRPAAGQFAQMIGKIAGVDVRMPPYETLGRFTTPGRPDAILDWLAKQDMSDVSAVIASTDMVCYGGLIASRVPDVPAEVAISRARRLVAWAHQNPKVKLYGFSSIMRLAPTATIKASPWRMHLAKYFELKDKWERTGDKDAMRQMKKERLRVPDAEIAKYTAARNRDVLVQKTLITLASHRLFDYLTIGQDDARQYGPFVAETQVLRKLVNELGVGGMVYFCEGIDQHAAMLVSRAILKAHGETPRVRVIPSDASNIALYSAFESKPLWMCLNEQLYASGARPVGPGEECDYTLYLNTPKRRPALFKQFVASIREDLDSGRPVAVADINFGEDGAADPELYWGLWQDNRMMKLLSYAGWNTAGNTMGTAIPAANVYFVARKLPIDPETRELAQKEFLLHRLVNDFAYHHYTRPQAYAMIDTDLHGSREETYGQAFLELNDFVRRDLLKQVDRTFTQQFQGKRFTAGDKEYAFSDIRDVKVFLPWPRAYEVRLSFNLDVLPVSTSASTTNSEVP